MVIASLFLSSCTSVQSHAPTVAFCELVSQPELFDKKIVRTEAVFYVNLENQVLYDPSCRSESTSTWAEFGNSYVYDGDDIKKSFDRLLCQTKPCPTGKVRVTVVGQFNGPSEAGYGHLNGYRFNFEIMRMEKAEAVPTNAP
jgi:hypothetical protein